jgi:hypothetical protein
MDSRRLSTGDVLIQGIVGMPNPKTDVPTDRENICVDYDDSEKTARDHLLADKVVKCPEYYGIPIAWKDGDHFRAILLQYKAVTEDHTFQTAEEAAAWFCSTARSVAG